MTVNDTIDLPAAEIMKTDNAAIVEAHTAQLHCSAGLKAQDIWLNIGVVGDIRDFLLKCIHIYTGKKQLVALDDHIGSFTFNSISAS